MKKVALVFVLAVFVPSLVLAWLAVRSLRDQQFVLERQQSLLYQGITDSLARQVETLLTQKQHEFAQQVEEMLANAPASSVAETCDGVLRSNLPAVKVGFSITTNGNLVCPLPQTGPAARSFRADNGKFLTGSESAEIYWNSGSFLKSVQNNVPVNNAFDGIADSNGSKQQAQTVNQNVSRSSLPEFKKAPQTRNVYPQQPDYGQNRDKTRSEEAQSLVAQQQFSRITPAETGFQQIIGEANEGTLARFVDNKLNLLFWYRSPRDSRYIFGAQLDLSRLAEELRALVQNVEPSLQDEICVAVVDDSAKPVALSRTSFQANWRHPFVATEIGEVLPHWEIAAYPLNPAKLSHSARVIKLTLGLLIALLVVAIGVGSWLIVSDLNRQLTLARQRTDFVSNVSHELKTPLTSIRMFSELLAEGRVTEPAKQRSYFHIITAETARLTRLINNVLDFSRMERGEKKYNFRNCDLIQIVRETCDAYRPHLENNGFALECDLAQSTLPIRGDADALAQVVVNLLSNAEKYSHNRREIAIQTLQRDGPLPCVEVKVLDRGLGVPRGSEEKIFEKFYRAHDSLSSGIQGSGLGLTLARQIARAHGGDVVYEPRPGGGSCFCLRLPLVREE